MFHRLQVLQRFQAAFNDIALANTQSKNRVSLARNTVLLRQPFSGCHLTRHHIIHTHIILQKILPRE